MLPGPASPTPPRSSHEIVRRIRDGGPATVALSGGVDSAVVAALAREALGARCLAVTISGPAVSAEEVGRAAAVASALGIPHRVVPVDPLDSAAYRANGPDRCFHCRTVEGGAIRAVARELGYAQLLDGIHVDDLGDERPGIRAMDSAGFDHPLVWGGWSKAEVRAEARQRLLPNWDQPSNACLASRVARGTVITADVLRQVETAEAVVAAFGFRRVRVRVRGSTARIEVGPDEVERLRSPGVREPIDGRLRALGFSSVEIDPVGYRSSARSIPVVPI